MADIITFFKFKKIIKRVLIYSITLNLLLISLIIYVLVNKKSCVKQNDEHKYPVYAIHDGSLRIELFYNLNPDVGKEVLLKTWKGHYGFTEDIDLNKYGPKLKNEYEECMADKYSITKNKEYCLRKITIRMLEPSGNDRIYSLIELAENIKDGTKIKKGDLLGYSATSTNIAV